VPQAIFAAIFACRSFCRDFFFAYVKPTRKKINKTKAKTFQIKKFVVFVFKFHSNRSKNPPKNQPLSVNQLSTVSNSNATLFIIEQITIILFKCEVLGIIELARSDFD